MFDRGARGVDLIDQSDEVFQGDYGEIAAHLRNEGEGGVHGRFRKLARGHRTLGAARGAGGGPKPLPVLRAFVSPALKSGHIRTEGGLQIEVRLAPPACDRRQIVG